MSGAFSPLSALASSHGGNSGLRLPCSLGMVPHFRRNSFWTISANVSPSRYTANRSIHAAGSEIRSQIHVRSEMHSVDTVKSLTKGPTMTATPDGLNMAVLNSFRPARHDLASIRTRIAAHLEDNDGYVAFSGGKDSLVVLLPRTFGGAECSRRLLRLGSGSFLRRTNSCNRSRRNGS